MASARETFKLGDGVRLSPAYFHNSGLQRSPLRDAVFEVVGFSAQHADLVRIRKIGGGKFDRRVHVDFIQKIGDDL